MWMSIYDELAEGTMSLTRYTVTNEKTAVSLSRLCSPNRKDYTRFEGFRCSIRRWEAEAEEDRQQVLLTFIIVEFCNIQRYCVCLFKQVLTGCRDKSETGMM